MVRDVWTSEITIIRKYPNNLLLTILKVIEDDGQSFELSEIFYDAVCLLLPIHPPMLAKDIAKLVQDHVVSSHHFKGHGR